MNGFSPAGGGIGFLGRGVFAKVQLEMDSTDSWGELVLLRSHWVKSVSFSIISLFFLLISPVWQKQKAWFGLSPWVIVSSGSTFVLSQPMSASWATQFQDCCALGAPGHRDSKMKLWRGRAALAAFNKGCSSTRLLSHHRRDSELSCRE